MLDLVEKRNYKIYYIHGGMILYPWWNYIISMVEWINKYLENMPDHRQ